MPARRFHVLIITNTSSSILRDDIDIRLSGRATASAVSGLRTACPTLYGRIESTRTKYKRSEKAGEAPLLDYICNTAWFSFAFSLGIRQDVACHVKQFIHLPLKRVLQRNSACSIGETETEE